MPQTGFQFHARRNEICEFVFETATKNNLYIVGAEWFPDFKYDVISDVNQLINNTQIREIVLSRVSPDTSLRSEYDFSIKNKGNLIIMPGQEANGIIKESNIGCISDENIDKLWIKIINGYKRKMLKGAWGVDPVYGARYFYKNHYYTQAAKEAYQEGYQLCAIAGNCVFEILE